MQALRKVFLHSPWHYVAALVISVAVTIFRLYTLSVGVCVRFAWYDALSVAGGVTFLVGALLTVTYFGAFDLFGYVFGRAAEKKNYKSYAQYANAKEEKRGKIDYYFVPYYAVGVVVFLISFLFA